LNKNIRKKNLFTDLNKLQVSREFAIASLNNRSLILSKFKIDRIIVDICILEKGCRVCRVPSDQSMENLILKAMRVDIARIYDDGAFCDRPPEYGRNR